MEPAGEILIVAFKDKKSQKKPVMALSTLAHTVSVLKKTRSGRVVQKPHMIVDPYKTGMGTVDVTDKMVYHPAADRTTERYCQKLSWNLLDEALLTDYIIYSLNNSNNVLTWYSFMVYLVESLCASEVPSVLAAPVAWSSHPLT